MESRCAAPTALSLAEAALWLRVVGHMRELKGEKGVIS